MTPERWQQIKHVVNEALDADAEARTALLQQSCADDFALRIGAEALLSVTRKLPEQPLAPGQWQRIEQLFQAALELEVDQRAAFLDQACGDEAELRHEVESLLIYQNAAGGLIQDAVHEAAGLLPHDEQARFTPGTTLNKRYRILGLLGKGGMGEVYRADDLTLQQPVALKFLTEKLARDKAMLARFRSEVAMAHRVTHPNVCRVHDIGEVITSAGVLPFLSMEYVDGEDLSSLLRRIGRLPSDKAVEIAQQLCEGLAAAHEVGVLHRDLKPANVMIDGRGRVRVTDFGLAGFAEQITGQEVFAGTPAYMSPEQFAGKEVTTKSDIYALGLVLYEVFTGKRVFEAGSLDELRRMHESSAPTNPSSWVKDLDPLVERVILRCLEKDPAKRLASAKQVADALPGGDPLAAALALGETPSPEMVAAAGQKTGMKPLYAVLCLLGIIAGLIAVAMMGRRLSLVEQVGLAESPEVMSGKARAMITQLGYTETPVDRAYGLQYDHDALEHLRKNATIDERKRLLATGRTSAIYFYYRESPTLLTPVEDISIPTLNDPPQTLPGMRSVLLDPSGQLLQFSAVGPQVEKNPAPGVVPDWKLPFALAGLEFNQFTPVEPEWTPDPPVPSDVRVAWMGMYPGQPAMPVRVEAAGYHGKLVSFRLLAPFHQAARVPAPPTITQRAAGVVSLLVFLSMILGSVWLAIRNVRTGRGDVRGAYRLAMFVFVISLISLFLITPGLTSLLNINPVFIRAAVALFSGVINGVVYLGLEPFVRRKWPQIVISWNRLLYGGWCDALVGRDLLLGLLFGLLVVLCYALNEWVKQRQGYNPDTRLFLDWLLSSRMLIIMGIGGVRGALNISLGACFMILLFRLALRRDWLTFVGWMLFITVWILLNDTLPMVPIGLIASSILTFTLIRFGLLPLVIIFVIDALLKGCLLTTNTSAWYASNGMIVACVILALAGFAFYTSLGGQKVFSGKLLEE
ncbi:MAG: serine/threonine protein kinase [Blastocatellia bacterium]|nr:serine/threonine protein kinase [Blastocatellia bacterium]